MFCCYLTVLKDEGNTWINTWYYEVVLWRTLNKWSSLHLPSSKCKLCLLGCIEGKLGRYLFQRFFRLSRCLRYLSQATTCPQWNLTLYNDLCFRVLESKHKPYAFINNFCIIVCIYLYIYIILSAFWLRTISKLCRRKNVYWLTFPIAKE